MGAYILPIAFTFANKSAKSNKRVIQPLLAEHERPDCPKAIKRPDYFHAARMFLFSSPPPLQASLLPSVIKPLMGNNSQGIHQLSQLAPTPGSIRKSLSIQSISIIAPGKQPN